MSYDRSKLRIGIVHFGVGNFHRSHQAMYLDRLLRDPETFEEASEWGICGVGVLPSDAGMRDALRSQDFEYTLVTKATDGETSVTRIGSIVDYLFAPEQLDAVLELLAAPSTRIVSLTITEGGYNIDDATGGFDVLDPAVLADIAPGATPRTVFGIVVAGLRRRRERGVPPFAILSCDNLEGNGDVARRSFAAFASLLDPDLGEWIETAVAFPCCMVDRITPTTTEADRAWLREELGIDDAWPVTSESFVQWVLEDDFPLGRPPLERAGVELVVDVRPYELMKLRLLNASHQVLAYSGILSGYTFVHEAASDPDIVASVRTYMGREARPSLPPVPGVDLEAYTSRLLERFASPAVQDTLARLATDGSDRIIGWLLPVIRERRHAGAPVPVAASVVAAWVAYAERHVLFADVPFRDRREAGIRRAVGRHRDDDLGFLRDRDWFGDLADDDGFVADYAAALATLRHRH